MGVLDFAGGTVVQYRRGFFGFGVCFSHRSAQRSRQCSDGAEQYSSYGLGTGLLWVGWFGFNAGSALAANGVAGKRSWWRPTLGGNRRSGLDAAFLSGR